MPQIAADHAGGFLVPCAGPAGLAGGLAAQPALEHVGQVRADRLNVQPAALAAARLQFDSGVVAVQAERARGEALKLARPEAGSGRGAVQHRPGGPVEAAEGLARIGGGRVDQPAQFLGAQGAALVSAIRFGIEAGQVGQGIFAGAPVAVHPSAELLDRSQVVLKALGAQAGPVAGAVA